MQVLEIKSLQDENPKIHPSLKVVHMSKIFDNGGAQIHIHLIKGSRHIFDSGDP